MGDVVDADGQRGKAVMGLTVDVSDFSRSALTPAGCGLKNARLPVRRIFLCP